MWRKQGAGAQANNSTLRSVTVAPEKGGLWQSPERRGLDKLVRPRSVSFSVSLETPTLHLQAPLLKPPPGILSLERERQRGRDRDTETEK